MHYQSLQDKGALTKPVEQRENIDPIKEADDSEFKSYRRKDGRFVSNGYDIESVAKMNEEEGRKQLAFQFNKVKHSKSFAENLEQSNPSIDKNTRQQALINQQERADNMVDKNIKTLPLTNDEKMGDPRISYGTGSNAYNVSISQQIDESVPRSAQEQKRINIANMYNLKEQHERKTKTNAEAPNKVEDLSLPPPDPYDATGSKNIGSNQGVFKDTEFMSIFDNYKLYKDGTVKNNRG